jgi:hypothetical protein
MTLVVRPPGAVIPRRLREVTNAFLDLIETKADLEGDHAYGLREPLGGV